MSLIAAIIAAAVTFLISITILLFVVGPTLLLQPRRRGTEFYIKLAQPVTPSGADLQYEELNIITDDNIKLNCWLIKAKPPAKGTLLYLHGVADCKISGIRYAKFLNNLHYNVFLFDSRRHGESGGEHCTYGYYEKNDITRIIDYLKTREDIKLGKIGLFGTSMGAAIAIQAAAIDKRISAVIAENSFATLRSIFDDYQKRMIKLPFHYLRNFVIVHSEFRAKFRARDVSPLDSIKKINIPVLIIYGTEDHLIKHEYSLQLYEQANQPKELFPIEGASHTDTWDIAGQEYEIRLTTFLEKYIQ